MYQNQSVAYIEPCPRKELFEYQQAQLEAEIENLSWKIEHAETTDRGDLENQMDIAEKRRYKSPNIFFPFLITHFQVQISERFSFFRTGLLRDFSISRMRISQK